MQIQHQHLKSLKKALLFLFLIFQTSLSAQNDEKKMDSLLNLSDYYLYIDYDSTIIFAKKALKIAIKKDNSNKKAESYYYIAKAYAFYRQFDESNLYLEKGLKEDALQKDVFLYAKFLGLKANYYSRMPLTEESYKYDLKILKLLSSKTDLESQILTAKSYMYIGDYYTENKKYRLANIYIDKSLKIINSIPINKYNLLKKIYRYKAYANFYKSYLLLLEQKPKKALYYIEQANREAKLEKYKYLAPFQEIFGDYYFQMKDYKKALTFYFLSENNKNEFHQYSALVDSKIGITYKMLGDSYNEAIYLKKSTDRLKIDHSLDTNIIQKELNRIQKHKDTEKENILQINKKITLIIVILLLLLIIGVYFIYKKTKKNKCQITYHKRVIVEKETLLKKKENELEKFHKKIVNNRFPELINLAKENSPHFWVNFQEIYPEYCSKLLQRNPDLKISELIFSAYVYLGFTTKEIANYTFKAIKTIENNRYNFRKRLGLKPEEELMIWLRKYIDDKNER